MLKWKFSWIHCLLSTQRQAKERNRTPPEWKTFPLSLKLPIPIEEDISQYGGISCCIRFSMCVRHPPHISSMRRESPSEENKSINSFMQIVCLWSVVLRTGVRDSWFSEASSCVEAVGGVLWRGPISSSDAGSAWSAVV